MEAARGIQHRRFRSDDAHKCLQAPTKYWLAVTTQDGLIVKHEVVTERCPQRGELLMARVMG